MLAKWRLLSEESKTIRTDDPASRLHSDLPGKPRYSKNVYRDESVRENLLTRTNVRFGSKAVIHQSRLRRIYGLRSSDQERQRHRRHRRAREARGRGGCGRA